jgi:hypothetical protein
MTVDLSAIAKWPNVPACYDWLSLDRRGNWRLQGERVTHSGLINFINRQYGCDESGCWFVQNGPQRVFVALAYTPWIFRRQGEAFISHTGEPTGEIKAIYLDEEGSILLETTLGIGLLDDRDLPAFLDQCRQGTNATVNEENWLKMMAGEAIAAITWHNLLLQTIHQSDVAGRFTFQPNPRPCG